MLGREKMENKTQEQIDAEYQYDNGFQPKEVVLPSNYKLYKKSLGFNLWRNFVILMTKFALFFPKHLVWGYKVVGKKYKRHVKGKNKAGALIVCNHSFTFDAFSLITALWPSKTYITTLQSNLGFGLVSKYFRSGGAVPIPTDPKLFMRFMRETPEILKSGKNILVYPEAMLMPYCDHIRKFEKGAFKFAMDGTDTILILCHTFHKPRGFYKLTRRKKPCIHLNILEPYKIKDMGNKRLTIETAQQEVHQIMSDYFNEHSDWFKK